MCDGALDDNGQANLQTPAMGPGRGGGGGEREKWIVPHQTFFDCIRTCSSDRSVLLWYVHSWLSQANGNYYQVSTIGQRRLVQGVGVPRVSAFYQPAESCRFSVAIFRERERSWNKRQPPRFSLPSKACPTAAAVSCRARRIRYYCCYKQYAKVFRLVSVRSSVRPSAR